MKNRAVSDSESDSIRELTRLSRPLKKIQRLLEGLQGMDGRP